MPVGQSTSDELKRSWLVQRLKKPYRGNSLLGKDNPFAFGGGYKNGGLADDAMDLLRGIFQFDYMGAAEFEWGAVPEALQAIAKSQDELEAWEFTIPLKNVQPNWRVDETDPPPEGDGTIYVLCPKEWKAEVKRRICGWAEKDYTDLKEATHLPRSLRPHEEWDGDTQGWLELNNGFMFFTDREMWTATAALFGVEVRANA